MPYLTTVNGIDFSFNFATEEVCTDAGTDRLDADSLQEAAREAETSEMGIVFPAIVNTSGKVTLDAFSETGLNVVLQGSWTVCTQKTTGLFTVGEGNVVSDVNGVEIFSSNPTVDTQNNTSQAGVRVLASDFDIEAALEVINQGVKLASIIVPHTEDLP